MQKYKQVKLKSRFSIMELSTLSMAILNDDVIACMPAKHLKEIQITNIKIIKGSL